MKIHRPYQLKIYDPSWEKKFLGKAQRLTSVLKDEVIAIHHIGSTAIPGMMAKPQIDILAVVKDLSPIPGYHGAMKKEGFTALGDYTGIGEEYFVEDAMDNTRTASLHILPIGHPEIEKQLHFRDYLRENKTDRDVYSSVKRKLYEKYPDKYSAYDKGKEKTIKAIKKRAKQWAKSFRNRSV